MVITWQASRAEHPENVPIQKWSDWSQDISIVMTRDCQQGALKLLLSGSHWHLLPTSDGVQCLNKSGSKFFFFPQNDKLNRN